MLFLRWLVLLLLITSIGLFLFYAATGHARYKQYGLIVLKWTLLTGFGFFAVLIAQRLAS